MAKFKIKQEVCKGKINDWRLCFQYGTYIYDDKTTQDGFRFIWRKPNNNLQPARGQARIPNEKMLLELIDLAKKEGWFKFKP